jgi:uncharacterized membrane protein
MLMPFFQWMNDWAASTAIRESIWIYPLAQAVHLLFLAMLVGGLLIVDLRLLGTGLTSQPVQKVARDARKWVIVGLVGLIVTGIPQLMSNSMREYSSDFFWMKMYVLPVALVFTFTVRHWVTMSEKSSESGIGKLVGLLSIALWAGVAIPSRLIGLF